MVKHILIRTIRSPSKKNPDTDLKWICKSLGMVSGRDRDETSAKIFRAVVDAFKRHQRVTSERLSDQLTLSRGTINHHLRDLIDSGFLVREKRELRLRSESIRRTIDEIRRDAERAFEDMMKVAEDIDSSLGFRNR